MKEAHSNLQTTEKVQVIVDAQKPGKGQSLSSGGVRDEKTGRIVSQYDHPREYRAPQRPVVRTQTNTVQRQVVSRRPTQQEIQQERRRQFRYDTEMYLADTARDILINGIFKPVAYAAISKGKALLTDLLNSDTTLYMDRYSDKQDEPERDNITEDKSSEGDKIIRFPDKRVG